VSLTASSFFTPGSAKLRLSSLPALDKVAEILSANDKRIIVEGHTDDTPIDDPQYPSNWELAGDRSSAVVRYFVKYHKLNPKRFVSISYGDQKPIVPNDTDEHKSMNRRIEILIVTDNNKVGI
jgi:chemotaxis protein MotB